MEVKEQDCNSVISDLVFSSNSNHIFQDYHQPLSIAMEIQSKGSCMPQ
jgi:hypothetical protein